MLAQPATLIVKPLGCQPYTDILQRMQAFTQQRQVDTTDALWLCQHPAVFTQGQAGVSEYVGQLGDIPLVHSNRGGQVTYHGPGQLVFYPLLNLTRLKIGVKHYVQQLEEVGIQLLAQLGITAERIDQQPGLYVQQKKIASLGLKIQKGCSYHGMAINIDMDLSPFQRITPCGLHGIQMTQVADYATAPDWSQLQSMLIHSMQQVFAYQHINIEQQEQPWLCPTSP